MNVSDLSAYSRLMTDYTELRYQDTRTASVALLNGDVLQNSRSTTSGISARTYERGVWGFASAADVSSESVAGVVQRAVKNAAFLKDRAGKDVKVFPRVTGKDEKDYTSGAPAKLQKDYIEFGKAVENYLKGKYPGLVSRMIVVSNYDLGRSLVNSQGSAYQSMVPRSIVYVKLTVESNGEPVEFNHVFGGFGQFQDNFRKPEDLFPKLDELYASLVKKSEGVYAEAGYKDVILDADLAGILAHEAIGHTTEADIVKAGSVAGFNLGKEVASPLVTLVDFAHTALGKLCPVPVFMDDEGTPATDTVIIEKGVLKGFMHNKESSVHFEAKPTGNARAWLFSDEPIVRMRNTAILPGKSKVEDMIASIDDGYYLSIPGNGQADATSEFMFSVTMGCEIKRGKLGRAIRDTTISGVAFDMLKTVTMLSDDMVWLNGGFCGKKQPMIVGMGGPAIKCKITVGGR